MDIFQAFNAKTNCAQHTDKWSDSPFFSRFYRILPYPKSPYLHLQTCKNNIDILARKDSFSARFARTAVIAAYLGRWSCFALAAAMSPWQAMTYPALRWGLGGRPDIMHKAPAQDFLSRFQSIS